MIIRFQKVFISLCTNVCVVSTTKRENEHYFISLYFRSSTNTFYFYLYVSVFSSHYMRNCVPQKHKKRVTNAENSLHTHIFLRFLIEYVFRMRELQLDSLMMTCLFQQFAEIYSKCIDPTLISVNSQTLSQGQLQEWTEHCSCP